jgi:hypothetical protein
MANATMNTQQGSIFGQINLPGVSVVAFCQHTGKSFSLGGKWQQHFFFLFFFFFMIVDG